MTFISCSTIALISGTLNSLSRSTMRTSLCSPTMPYSPIEEGKSIGKVVLEGFGAA